MKSVFLLMFLFICSVSLMSQDYYWVYFTDKNSCEFNPYEYFDQKAIERREKNNLSLNDISDFPLNSNYIDAVSQLADEYVGETRWFNAVAIFASDDAIKTISGFDFVLKVEKIISEPVLCEFDSDYVSDLFELKFKDGVLPQLHAMGGEEFVQNDIDGKGIRIAVLDGGFPGVDTHDAFAHLRKNQQIKKTYNFPKKQENVYGWNSHGTMVLSCIAGLDRSGNKMGLATGSEFLLARTEVNAEPAKEEVYWMMAMEWADKNGADVINSSLGYGADRHNPEDMDGQTCLVTRAANMAASKGILVCNAMGNEGDDRTWKTLGAPADADSILSIGGVRPRDGEHINFSSYGPTADGRMKPNVSAFGEADVAKPGNVFSSAFGTSFASPLVAGFVACAWQSDRDLTNMELKSEIEKSADHYPYYDYALGYGVPQAGYFTNQEKKSPTKRFNISSDDQFVVISINERDSYEEVGLYYHIENADGQLEHYSNVVFWMNSSDQIKINKNALSGGKVLRVLCEGYVEEYKVDESDIVVDNQKTNEPSSQIVFLERQRRVYKKEPQNDKATAFGVNSKFYIFPYFSLGFITPPQEGYVNYKYGKSRTTKFGVKYINNLSKWYRIGLNLEYNQAKYHYELYTFDVTVSEINPYFKAQSLNLGLFQRIRLIPGTMTGVGTYFDLGVYGSYVYKLSDVQKGLYNNTGSFENILNSSNYNSLNWGIQAGFGHGLLSVYTKYRMSDILNGLTTRIPKLEVGFELAIPLGG